MTFWPKEVFPSEELLNRIGSERLRQLTAQVERQEQELEGLRSFKAGELLAFARAMVQPWTESLTFQRDRVYVDDPVSGHLCVEPELAGVLRHPLVQRLNHIKQLSFGYLVFPTATHTRLSHSLGACKCAELALSAIFRNDMVYSARGTEIIKIDGSERRRLILKAKTAAMLHDVGHGPFGHALDRFIGFIDPKHPAPHPDKHYSRKYIQSYLARALSDSGIAPENLAMILGKDRTSLKGWDSLLADLVDSSLDVDRMDYLTRDAHMTGLSMGVTNVGALIEKMCPYLEGEQIVLTYDSSCLPYVDDFLYARDMMFINCYDHPRKVAADRIFTRLVQNLIADCKLSVDQIMILADEQILALLSLTAASSSENRDLWQALLNNRNYEIIHQVGIETENPNIDSFNRARNKGMGKLAYVDLPNQWEKTITEQAGLDAARAWQLLVVVPAHEVSIPVESGTRILYRDAGGFYTKELFTVLPRLHKHLKDLTSERQRIRVFCEVGLSDEEKTSVLTVARAFLGPS